MTRNEAPICVTGVTGFLSSHIVKQLLDKNYVVHGTVRSLKNKEKYDYLLALPNADKNLRLFEADLLVDNSFDEVVRGCQVVIHTASPVVFNVKDAQKELVDPALKGTLNVLQSCAKESSVRRVVLTSSAAAVYPPSQISKDRSFNEDDWNTESTLEKEPYRYSKVLAEKAAWDLAKNAQFDLVVLNPPFIIGEVLGSLKTLDDMNLSNKIVLQNVLNAKNGKSVAVNGFGIVNVTDVAAAHVKAATDLENPLIKNKRFVIADKSYSFPEIAREAMRVLPEEFSSTEIKIDGDEAYGKDKRTPLMDGSRWKTIYTDFKYKPLEVSIKDLVHTAKKNNLWH